MVVKFGGRWLFAGALISLLLPPASLSVAFTNYWSADYYGFFSQEFAVLGSIVDFEPMPAEHSAYTAVSLVRVPPSI